MQIAEPIIEDIRVVERLAESDEIVTATFTVRNPNMEARLSIQHVYLVLGRPANHATFFPGIVRSLIANAGVAGAKAVQFQYSRDGGTSFSTAVSRNSVVLEPDTTMTLTMQVETQPNDDVAYPFESDLEVRLNWTLTVRHQVATSKANFITVEAD